MIRHLRTERGIPQDQIPDIHATYVSAIENGHRNPSWEAVERLLRGLGVSVSEFGAAYDELDVEV